MPGMVNAPAPESSLTLGMSVLDALGPESGMGRDHDQADDDHDDSQQHSGNKNTAVISGGCW